MKYNVNLFLEWLIKRDKPIEEAFTEGVMRDCAYAVECHEEYLKKGHITQHIINRSENDKNKT